MNDPIYKHIHLCPQWAFNIKNSPFIAMRNDTDHKDNPGAEIYICIIDVNFPKTHKWDLFSLFSIFFPFLY